MSEKLKAKFGDLVENGWASEANPTRTGYFVREFRRPHGRMNAGLTWEITDGKGKFWELSPVGDHKITVTPRHQGQDEARASEYDAVAVSRALSYANRHAEDSTDPAATALFNSISDSVKATESGVEFNLARFAKTLLQRGFTITAAAPQPPQQDDRDERIAALEGWGSKAHINALGAFLVSRCGVAVEAAGDLAFEMIDLASDPARGAK